MSRQRKRETRCVWFTLAGGQESLAPSLVFFFFSTVLMTFSVYCFPPLIRMTINTASMKIDDGFYGEATWCGYVRNIRYEVYHAPFLFSPFVLALRDRTRLELEAS